MSIRGHSPPPAYSPPNRLGQDVDGRMLLDSTPANTSNNAIHGLATNASAPSVAPQPQAPVGGHAPVGHGMPLPPGPIPFYHPQPIVPIPPGMEPIPIQSNTTFPLRPDEQTSTNSQVNWYFNSVGVHPGLHRATWDDFRPNIEAHRVLPRPYRPDWGRVRTPLPETLPRIRVLPPPPRPPVQREGDHYWVVYVGRIPGIYSTLYVPIACIVYLI